MFSDVYKYCNLKPDGERSSIMHLLCVVKVRCCRVIALNPYIPFHVQAMILNVYRVQYILYTYMYRTNVLYELSRKFGETLKCSSAYENSVEYIHLASFPAYIGGIR